MPSFNEVLEEIRSESASQTRRGNPFDAVRQRYLKKLNRYTNRNVIAYYSGWLHKSNHLGLSVNDKDMQALMQTIHGMDRTKGLDLILHTPGGDIAATEALVNYLHSMFTDIRAVVPQLCMSAGTMIALSCNTVVMGKHSSLGPVDPQFGTVPAQGILDEFEKAKKEVSQDPKIAPLWREIISKYPASFLNSCEQAIEWSHELVEKWLANGMCNGNPDMVAKIVKVFGDRKESHAHNRHIPLTTCIEAGVHVTQLEEDQALQEIVLTLHHAYMHTLANTYAVKIVENHKGIAYVEAMQPKTS